MKKIILTLVSVFLMSVNGMANESENDYKSNWIKVESLSRYLNLNSMQQEEVQGIQKYFDEQLERASRIKGNRRAVKTEIVVKENLKLMHDILRPEQFRKYVTTLNLTLENRGLRQYVG